ncbi:hypothetical protein KKR94_p00310 (plasmid) [Klebsiella pneumoniae]|nr:hypothetical protein KKR94_p00310 [Klebsiella pneumoniae]
MIVAHLAGRRAVVWGIAHAEGAAACVWKSAILRAPLPCESAHLAGRRCSMWGIAHLAGARRCRPVGIGTPGARMCEIAILPARRCRRESATLAERAPESSAAAGLILNPPLLPGAAVVGNALAQRRC